MKIIYTLLNYPYLTVNSTKLFINIEDLNKKIEKAMGYITIPVKTWYLQKDKQIQMHLSFPLKGKIEEWHPVNNTEYLDVYNAIGKDWGWTGRVLMKENELQDWLNSDQSKFYILKIENNAAGFMELDFKDPSRPEIVYFGLMPDYIGQQLGLPFLTHTVHTIELLEEVKNVWLHTCEYDHPSAIKVYQKAGFEIYKEEVDEEPYDEDFLKEFKEKFRN
ncbi:GNAT family N-acetyltransferase [Flammeovirga sp. SJP92]|uniref:GNAT family N-acetyltransferase n=1 Tax=Flammeovirga sp. SJP92 TaxID=1775430 RepID=UPI000787555C|nr:GNAT family N-acetyltransferase [Flammeovirga sp. SJP92]